MSANKINSRTWLILQSDDGNTYLPVGCLTNNDMDLKIPPIDVSSKCGNEWIAGVKFDEKLTGTAFTDDQYGSITLASAAKIRSLCVAQTVTYWKVGPANPTTGDNYYTGVGVVIDWKEVAKDGDANVFDFSVQITLPPMTAHNAY